MEKEQREMGGGSIQVLGFKKKKGKKVSSRAAVFPTWI